MQPPKAKSELQDVSPAKIFSRTAECTVLFVLVPVFQALGWFPVPLIPLLWLAGAGCALVLLRDTQFQRCSLRRFRVPPAERRRVLLTFLAAIPLLMALVWYWRPSSLFAFPLRRTRIWLLVMVLYPLLSVYPQEIIYRAFFFHRYPMLFGNARWMIVSSAIAFGLTHVTFHNWVAVALTVPGGLLFARTYRRTGALLFVAFEHALYGAGVFTIGLGGFLVEGTFRLVR